MKRMSSRRGFSLDHYRLSITESCRTGFTDPGDTFLFYASVS